MKNTAKQFVVIIVFIILCGYGKKTAQYVFAADGKEFKIPPSTAPAPPESITEKFDINNRSFLLYQENGHIKLITKDTFAKYVFTSVGPTFDWQGTSSSFEITNKDGAIRLYWHADIRGPGWLNVTLDQKSDGSIHVLSTIHERPPLDRVLEKDYKSYAEIANADAGDVIAGDVKLCLQNVTNFDTLLPKGIFQNLLFDKPIPLTDSDKKEFADLLAKTNDDDFQVRADATVKLKDYKFLGLLKQHLNDKLLPEQRSRIEIVLSAYKFAISKEMAEKMRD